MKNAEKAQPFPQNNCVIASSWNPSRLPGHLPRPAAMTACPAWKGAWSPADPDRKWSDGSPGRPSADCRPSRTAETRRIFGRSDPSRSDDGTQGPARTASIDPADH